MACELAARLWFLGPVVLSLRRLRERFKIVIPRKLALMLRTRARSHDMILIDELHRNGSLGVGQGLFGGLQIGAHPPLFTGSGCLLVGLPDRLSLQRQPESIKKACR